MKKLEPGFPRFKGEKKEKSGFLKRESDKTKAKKPIRKQVIKETHERAKGKCEAEWIAPHISCGKGRDADEIVPRSGGGDPLDVNETQSLCRKCHTVKGLEVAASEILGLYGNRRKSKHVPINEEELVEAKERFGKAKERLKI